MFALVIEASVKVMDVAGAMAVFRSVVTLTAFSSPARNILSWSLTVPRRFRA
jgi:hypothetical protein